MKRGDSRELWSSIRKRLLCRSRPMVVLGPWPGYTRVSSGSVSNRRSEASMASGSLVGKSVLPIEPWNRGVSADQNAGGLEIQAD